jgi:hypothetical protein
VGPPDTVPVNRVKPEFEFIQTSLNDFKPFQINSNMVQSKQDLAEFEKLK